MRGLDTRVQLAHARIAAVAAGDRADDSVIGAFIDVFECARLQGSHDAQVGIHEPPLMFAGEPDLLGWWEDGQESVFALREMAECPGCNDGTGCPCHIHG